MGLEVIYVTRHGFRSNWAVDPSTGEYTASISSPTGIAADPALTSHGVDQATQLAARLRAVDPPIGRVYSSPYYRCLQTVEPFVAQPVSRSPLQGEEQFRIRGEPGLGEWYGAAPFEHPTSAAPGVLKRLCPALDLGYEPVARPTRMGESLAQLHDRVAATMDGIISQCDAEGVSAVLICTHAAVVIALGRVLTGAMPENVDVEDFRAFTCGLSVYVKKEGEKRDADAAAAAAWGTDENNPTGRISGGQEAHQGTSGKGIAPDPPAEPCPRRRTSRTDPEPRHSPESGLAWKGRGVAGGWVCTADSDCSHLAAGEERGWRFSGDEAFTNAASAAQGADAGLELGIVVGPQAARTRTSKTSGSSRL